MTENKALDFIRRREKNLRYFQRSYPDIYKFYVNYQLKRAEVVISNAEDEIDLQIDGKSLYQGKGKDRGKQGADLFRSTFAEGHTLPSLPPPWPGEYKHPRFAHQQVDQIIRRSPLKKEEFSTYTIPNFYPLVVFQGVGLGYQIQQLVATSDIENAIVIEPDVEIFGASLLTIDWEEVCSKFNRTDRAIRFLIGVEHTEESLWPALLKHLMHFTPMFPVMNLFLNERGDPVMDSVAKRLNKEAIATLSTWGHYDDEVRQLNNAIHAFHLGVKVIPPKGSISSDIPVLIVGSGPSLDDRIADIKKSQDKAIIVSAGTGLRVLIENEIYPDFHVELESDYNTYKVINSYNLEKLKSTRIIAASQVCPLIWNLFGEKRLYFKRESPIGALFGAPSQNIIGSSPTCTNAAVALCTQLGLTNIFLFGMDFGFTDHERHHSKQSIYLDGDYSSEDGKTRRFPQKLFEKSRTFPVKAVNGDTVQTTPFYFTARRSLEGLMEATGNLDSNYSFSNCSDGASIEGTTWLAPKDFIGKIELRDMSLEKDEIIRKIFREDAQTISIDNIEETLDSTKRKLEFLANRIETDLKSRRMRGKRDITRFCSVMSRYLEGELQQTDIGFYYMIRGAVRHFMYAGFAHAFAMNDKDDVALYLNRWKEGFIACMKAMPKHFESVTGKTYSLKKDPWVTQSINDPED